MYFGTTRGSVLHAHPGSGRVKLADGSTVRVHYDGHNATLFLHRRYLIDKGRWLPTGFDGRAEKLLKVDPERGNEVMWRTPPFVFFRELKARRQGSARAITPS